MGHFKFRDHNLLNLGLMFPGSTQDWKNNTFGIIYLLCWILKGAITDVGSLLVSIFKLTAVCVSFILERSYIVLFVILLTNRPSNNFFVN